MEWIIFSYNTGYLHLIFVSCPKSVYTEWRIHGTIIPTDRRFVQHALRSDTKYTQLHHNCIKNRGYIVVIKRKEKEIKKKIKNPFENIQRHLKGAFFMYE